MGPPDLGNHLGAVVEGLQLRLRRPRQVHYLGRDAQHHDPGNGLPGQRRLRQVQHQLAVFLRRTQWGTHPLPLVGVLFPDGLLSMIFQTKLPIPYEKRSINPSWISERPPPEKRGFPVAHKISDLPSLILAVRPCTAGNAE